MSSSSKTPTVAAGATAPPSPGHSSSQDRRRRWRHGGIDVAARLCRKLKDPDLGVVEPPARITTTSRSGPWWARGWSRVRRPP